MSVYNEGSNIAEELPLPCLMCGQGRQCQKLLCGKELEVTSNFCKLLDINYLDIRDLSFEEAYYCSECSQELMLISRLQTDLEEINMKLNFLKSECLLKFKIDFESMSMPRDTNDLESFQVEKRRKFCYYITNGGHPRLRTVNQIEVKEENYGEYVCPLPDAEVDEPDHLTAPVNSETVHEEVEARTISVGNDRSLKRHKTIPRSQRASKPSKQPKKAISLVKEPKGPSRRSAKIVPKTDAVLNELEEEVPVRSTRSRARKDYSKLFVESSEGSDSESSSDGELGNDALLEKPPETVGESVESQSADAEFCCANSGAKSLASVEVVEVEDADIAEHALLDTAKGTDETSDINAGVPLTELWVRVSKLADDDSRILASKKKWEIKGHYSKGFLRYICPVRWCKNKFPGPLQCKVHYRKFHMKIADAYECEECWTRFTTKEEYEEHEAQESVLRREREEKLKQERTYVHPIIQTPYSCDECGKSFRKRRQLKSHMDTHASDVYEPEKPEEKPPRGERTEIFRCSVVGCKARFWREILMQAHVAMVHEGVERPFVCAICQKDFKELRSLQEHQNLHSNEKPFECPDCPQRFSLRRKRDYHVTQVHKPKKFQCDTCGMVFYYQTAFKAHLLTHSGDRPHICEVCGLSFKRADSLRRHLPDHPELNLPKCICAYCGKVFKDRIYLKNHEKTHTGEGLVHCTQCEFTAPTKNLIRSHMISHITDRQHECGICSKKFKTERAVKKHKESSHAPARDHICKECGKGFFSSVRLRVHVFNIHEGRSYSCSICQSTFSRKGNVRRHMISYHPGEVPRKPYKPGRPSVSDAKLAALEQSQVNPKSSSHRPARKPRNSSPPPNTLDHTIEPSQPQPSFSSPKRLQQAHLPSSHYDSSMSVNLPSAHPELLFPNQYFPRTEEPGPGSVIITTDGIHSTPAPFPDFQKFL